ncbi:helicase-related protein [Nocardioides perillae]|uniref:helicase-related protein n=1 Tax=Nocardioides perillae TaxID=1119534 RepID=UPI0031B6282A
MRGAANESSAVYGTMNGDERELLLPAFKERDTTVLTAPRVLDEGVDVPEADLGVIVSASSSKRQMIQRMGRVLRLKQGDRTARLVVLFAEGTVEDPREGAYESLIGFAWEVADEAEVFASSASVPRVLEFLRPTFDGPEAPSTRDRGCAPSYAPRPR